MALSQADYRELRKALYSGPAAKDDMKALPNLPNETQLLAALQAADDWFVNNLASLRTAIQTGYGQTIPNGLADKIIAIYMKRRAYLIMGW